MPWLGIRGNGTLSHALPRKFRLAVGPSGCSLSSGLCWIPPPLSPVHEYASPRSGTGRRFPALRFDFGIAGGRVVGVLQLPRADLLPPGAAGGAAIGIGFGGSFLEELDELDQDPFDVADYGHFGSADLADFGRVDIDVDDFGVRGEGGEASGDAMVDDADRKSTR